MMDSLSLSLSCVLRVIIYYHSDKAIRVTRFIFLFAPRAGRVSVTQEKARAAPSLRSERFSGVNESDLKSGVYSRWLSSWEPQSWGTTQSRPRGLHSRRRRRRRRLLLPLFILPRCLIFPGADAPRWNHMLANTLVTLRTLKEVPKL